ncbi:MAG: LysR family transcriptional regulator [Pigmentiphaga sp.]|uniref:LysR family transcriptional regulator n=1 Tax=Pigmentiphaga sp. TaxID=1977564 RepID=UPI0029B2EE45|nr:LysR family transcriptional regulator [Pigmentiphaga sp.]MDX3906283.1 LysR family transcriptional regulator [Pigmentiphaga sp.]
MRTQLTIQELEAFIAVADTLNFRAAAALCFVSQPALSRTVAAAESKLGTRLFDRNTRRVTLTSSGEELLPIARRIVFELRDSLSDLSEFVAGRKGSFTIASLPALAASILPRPMHLFLAAHPNVSIGLQSVSTADVLRMVQDGSAQIGVTSQPPSDMARDIHFTPFVNDDLILICPEHDALAREAAVSWEVFAQRPYIANGPASSLRPLVERVLADRRITVEPRYESVNLSVTARMVAAGLGIAVIPTLARGLVNPEGLAFVRLTDPAVSRNIGVATRKGRSLSGPAYSFVQAFLAHHGIGQPSGRADGATSTRPGNSE